MVEDSWKQREEDNSVITPAPSDRELEWKNEQWKCRREERKDKMTANEA
jgi:hypothetical protein